MVGAPTATVTTDPHNFQRIRDTGTVYKCLVTEPKCGEVFFDLEG